MRSLNINVSIMVGLTYLLPDVIFCHLCRRREVHLNYYFPIVHLNIESIYIIHIRLGDILNIIIFLAITIWTVMGLRYHCHINNYWMDAKNLALKFTTNFIGFYIIWILTTVPLAVLLVVSILLKLGTVVFIQLHTYSVG